MADETIPEEWRIVRDFPDYEVSDLGHVRRATTMNYRRIGRPLRGAADRQGYLIVRLYPSGSYKKIHQLVCRAFHGDPPNEAPHVAHANGNPSDNRASNLRWVSPKENSADRHRHGRTPSGSSHYAWHLTEKDEIAIREMLSTVKSTRKTAAAFGVGRSTIVRIRDGKRSCSVYDNARWH